MADDKAELPVPHPAESLVVRLLAPARGEAWVKFRQEMDQRQRLRGQAALAETQAASGLSSEEILERLASDEQLADLFAATFESAMRIRWEAKLRGLGRVLALGLHADSDTAVDATEVLHRIIDDLDPPHARALAAIAEAGRFNPGAAGTDALSEWLLERFPGMGAVANQVGAVLLRHGLVTDPFYVNGVLTVTDLGRTVLELLQEPRPSGP